MFDRITMRPKVLAAIVLRNVTSLDDNSNAMVTIKNALAQSLSMNLRQSALNAKGAGVKSIGLL